MAFGRLGREETPVVDRVTVKVVEDGYLPLKDLSRYTGLSVRTLRKLLRHPTHPLPHYRLEGKILVRKSDFDAWVRAYRVSDGGKARVDLDALVDGVMAGLRR